MEIEDTQLQHDQESSGKKKYSSLNTVKILLFQKGFIICQSKIRKIPQQSEGAVPFANIFLAAIRMSDKSNKDASFFLSYRKKFKQELGKSVADLFLGWFSFSSSWMGVGATYPSVVNPTGGFHLRRRWLAVVGRRLGGVRKCVYS